MMVAPSRAPRYLILAVILPLLPSLCGFDLLQGPNSDVDEGNRQLAAGKPDKALEAYRRAVAAVGDDPALHFDEGTALLALRRFPEAQAELQRSAQGTSDPTLEAAAFFNLGNTFFDEKQYKDAAGAYIRTLRLEPSDRRAKWNLELALRAARDEKEKEKAQPKPAPGSQPSKGSPKDGAGTRSSDPASQPAGQPPHAGPKSPPSPPPADPASAPARMPSSAPASPPPSSLTKQKVDELLDSIDHNYKAFAVQGAAPAAQPEKDW